MPSLELHPRQQEVIHLPDNAKIFLSGPAGSGKTTVGVERMLYLMSSGVPGNSILIIVPQRALGTPYTLAMNTPGVVAGGMVDVVTISGLAQHMVDLFWPIVAEKAGFSNPTQPPIFLNLETAQYYMAHVVRPMLDQGYFGSVTIDRNRLYSQIIDNLNKAAVVGFPHTEIGERLKAAWTGDSGQLRVYDDAQACASLFRQYCLAHNLLDFSLQVEVFWQHLWKSELCHKYLVETYRHLIIDNVEEDVPVTHDLLMSWLPLAQSCLIIFDDDAGYRRFLGADPRSARRLIKRCDVTVTFEESYITSPEIASLAVSLNNSLIRLPPPAQAIDPRPAIVHETHTYYPQMLDWVTNNIVTLVNEEGLSPGDIVILAPFLSDSLRFSLVHRLQNEHIPVKTHRPSRSLREEPATFCLLTLASIAHPEWEQLPSRFDLAHALIQAIEGLDLIRARLLTEIVYRDQAGEPVLHPFDQIIPSTQERISYVFGEKYDHLRLWLEEYRQSEPAELDLFISRLFGEVLSQPGYGFHSSFDMGQVTANLVDSIRKFRRVTGDNLAEAGVDLNREYMEMVHDGVIAAQYLPGWQTQMENAVFIAPAYTYLVNNYPVEVQFWLDVGSNSWSERLFQPLTHPYVLSRNWKTGKVWSDSDEVETSEQVLVALVSGLLRRCRSRVYLGLSEYNEQGYEQRGPLLQAFHRILQSLVNDEG
jgi:hypothetical protein